MNQVSVFGKVFSKVEFFDLVFDTFHEADYAQTEELEQRYTAEYHIQLGILRSLGWLAEYRQWVANGCN